jgi:hypothetical protein
MLVDHGQIQLGDDVSLLSRSPDHRLHSYAKVDDDWTEVSPPSIPGNPPVDIFHGSARGNRFVALEYGTLSSKQWFHLLDWSATGGWTQYGLVTASQNIQNLFAAAFEGDRLVVVASIVSTPGYWALIYRITPTGLEQVNSYNFPGYQPKISTLVMSGDYLLFSANKSVTAFNMANGFSSQIINPYNDASLSAVGRGLFPAGPGKALVDSQQGFFWLTLNGSLWTLEPTGFEKGFYLERHVSGGNGSMLVLNLDSNEHNNLSPHGVFRVSDYTEVGKINSGRNFSTILTNG